MSPIILASGDQPEIAAGASGGRRILAAVLQLLSFVAEFGMEPEAAAHHPRIDVSGPEGVTADRRLPPEVLAALPGTPLVVEHAVLPLNFACPNLILRGPGGEATGISDVMTPWSGAVAA
jgi:gamma-glutamyltranspeptidase/glutathione hydrolase